MSEELKPCPFCGGTPTVITDDLYDGSISIECCQVGCRANVQGETYDLNEKDKAIEHWNTRKGEDERIAQAVGIEKREARLNLENRMKEQLLEAVQAEREQIIKRLNRQIIGYIQDKSLDFETTATLKEATDIAIKIVKGE